MQPPLHVGARACSLGGECCRCSAEHLRPACSALNSSCTATPFLIHSNPKCVVASAGMQVSRAQQHTAQLCVHGDRSTPLGRCPQSCRPPAACRLLPMSALAQLHVRCSAPPTVMQADMETLHKMLHMRHVTYQFNHRK